MRLPILFTAAVFSCAAAFAQEVKDGNGAQPPQPPQNGQQAGQPAAGNGGADAGAKTPQPPAKPEKKDDKQSAAKADVDKVAFSATDVCSQTACEIRYDVKAMGNKAFVEMTYVSNAAALGRHDGSTSTMILDLENNTIKYLSPKRKLYSVRNTNGLSATPLAKIIAALRATPDVGAFMKDTKPHGTLGELKTIDTTIANAEQNAKFSNHLMEVPSDYKRMREDVQQGTIGGSGFPGTILGGGGR